MTVGIDGYVWLHRACISCAYELCVGLTTQAYITYFVSRVKMMLAEGIKLVVVFDGADLPTKGKTDEDRGKRRQAHHEKAKAFLAKGDKVQAANHYSQAFDITPDLASTVATILKRNGVDTVIAPYEADGQLAYLARNGFVDAVVTEDSDLIAHGVPRVFTKMDQNGMGELFHIDEVIKKALSVTSAEGRYEHFLNFCILCGCDYLTNLKGLGPKKAAEFAKDGADINEIILNIAASVSFSFTPAELEAYKDGFWRALFAFKHQRVIDPSVKEAKTLTPLSESKELVEYVTEHVEGGVQALIGADLTNAQAEGLQALTLDPSTLQPYEGKYNANLAASNVTIDLNAGKTLKQKTLGDFFVVKKRRVVAKPAAPTPPASPPPTPKTPKTSKPPQTPIYVSEYFVNIGSILDEEVAMEGAYEAVLFSKLSGGVPQTACGRSFSEVFGVASGTVSNTPNPRKRRRTITLSTGEEVDAAAAAARVAQLAEVIALDDSRSSIEAHVRSSEYTTDEDADNDSCGVVVVHDTDVVDEDHSMLCDDGGAHAGNDPAEESPKDTKEVEEVKVESEPTPTEEKHIAEEAVVVVAKKAPNPFARFRKKV